MASSRDRLRNPSVTVPVILMCRRIDSAHVLELNVLSQEGWILFVAALRYALLDMQLRFTERYTNHSLFVQVKASSYTILIASGLRNVPNIL